MGGLGTEGQRQRQEIAITLVNTILGPIRPYTSDSEVHVRLYGNLSFAPNIAHANTCDLLGLGELMSTGTSEFAAEIIRRNGPESNLLTADMNDYPAIDHVSLRNFAYG